MAEGSPQATFCLPIPVGPLQSSQSARSPEKEGILMKAQFRAHCHSLLVLQCACIKGMATTTAEALATASVCVHPPLRAHLALPSLSRV